MKLPTAGVRITGILTGCLLFTLSTFADLKPFPLSAGQRGTVDCLDHPYINYDIYLPSAYSTNGPALPILYTLNPNGGGLVSQFRTVCSNLNIITVGVKGSSNGASLQQDLRDFYAVPHDVRQRVRFNPTAEFVAGYSGGGECAYIFSRFWAQHVSGIFAMSGWMGCTFGASTNGLPVYYRTSQVQTNLRVARTTGTSDLSTQKTFLAPDGVFLVSCGAVLKDWSFSGGHSIPADSVKTSCLTWLLTNRATAGPTDESNALAQAANWHSRADTGQSEAVLRECVAALMSQPRSWFALQAQLVMDDLMTNYDSFRSLNVSNLAPGDFAYDLFFYSAVGVAATYNDWQRYWGNLKPLTGITDTSGDRSGDMLTVLSRFGYPAPLIQISPGPAPDQATVWLQKDAPGLAYSLQSQTGLHPDYWQDIFPPAFDTNTLWSTMVDLDRGSGSVFYRVGTTFDFYITPSPPWPNGFNGL